MIELVITSCFMVAPYNCRVEQQTYSDVSMFQCVMQAQIELARWKDSHPNWHIVRYVCQPAGMFAKL